MKSKGLPTGSVTLQQDAVVFQEMFPADEVYRLAEWDLGEPVEPEISVREITRPQTTLLVEVGMGAQAHLAIIDTGAQVMVLSDAIVCKIGVPDKVLDLLPKAKLKGFGKTGFVEGKQGLKVTFHIGN